MIRQPFFTTEFESTGRERGVRMLDKSIDKVNVMFHLGRTDRIIAQCNDEYDAEIVRKALEFAALHYVI